jgi:hypothetical protein
LAFAGTEYVDAVPAASMTVTNPFIAYCLVYKDNINSVLGFISYNN